MPRDTLNIKTFNTGLVTNIDEKDLPIDAGVSGTKNLDPNANGKLQGAPLRSVMGSAIAVPTAKQFGFIERNTDQFDLVLTNSSDTQFITDFYGTDAVTDDGDADSSECLVINREEAHIGCGVSNNARWSGYIRHGQFGNSAPTTLQHDNAECSNPFNIIPSASTANGDIYIESITQVNGTNTYWIPGRQYYYALTVVYDGFQESPMVDFATLGRGSVYFPLDIFVAGLDSKEYHTVKIRCKGWSGNLSKRISAINLYRAESSTLDFADRGLFRLLTSIDINDSWTTATLDEWIEYDDYGDATVTYEANSGIPENIYSTGMKYKISCEVSSYHFVGNCLHDELTSDDGTHMIFRSKAYWYDTFDWTKDFLRLPFIPKAMASYNNKVYVFDDNKIATINPAGLFVEDIYDGVGCETQQGFVVTEHGMYFANIYGCYAIRNNQLEIISDRIRNDWQTDVGSGATPAYPKIALTYDAETFQIIFGILSANGGEFYAYHIPTKRWDYYDSLCPNDTPSGIFSGVDGESYVTTPASADSGLYKMFGTGANRAFEWYSPEYDFNDPTQLKKFYEVETDEATATATTLWGVDGGALGSVSMPLQNKTFQVKVSGNSTAVVDSVGIIYRRMLGKR